MISLIYQIQQNSDEVYVQAVVEDMVQTHAQTYYDPPEYGPALCEATFCLDEDEVLPSDEDSIIDYLESLDLEWKVIKEDFD